MITAHIETGRVRVTAFGEDAIIIRKSKKIKIPSAEIETKLIGRQQNVDFDSKEFEKLRDEIEAFRKDYPKLMDGDTVVCGKKTVVHIEVFYNRGKDKPIDDYKQIESKSVYMGPNSELEVSDFEKWDKIDSKDQRHYGELLRNIELKKGFFYVSYSHTEDILKTPVALLKFIFDGSGFIDVYDDSIYSNVIASSSIGAGGVEFTNKLTKRSFVAKSSMSEEIIVTRDGIYRKGLTKMDNIFQNSIILLTYFTNKHQLEIPELNPKKMIEQYKNMPKTMEQVTGGMEMMMNMKPEDIERMMKIGEAHGAKVSPEMLKQMKEAPEALKAMEQSGKMKELKKAMAMSKGLMEGLEDKGIERLVNQQMEAGEKMKNARMSTSKITTSEGSQIEVEKLLESPRKYNSLTDAKKVA
jgi:hypothetical protein